MPDIHNFYQSLERGDLPPSGKAFKLPTGKWLFGWGPNNTADADVILHVDTSQSAADLETEFGYIDAIQTHLLSSQAQVMLPLFAWQEEDGTALAQFSDGASATPGYAQFSNEPVGIRWNNHATPDAIAISMPMPQDLDDSADVVLHLLGTPTGTTDSPTFTVEAYFNTVGAALTADADAGGTTSEFTADTNVQEATLTIAAANVPASPSVLTIIAKPTAGQLGTDDFVLVGAWLEYTRQLLSA